MSDQTLHDLSGARTACVAEAEDLRRQILRALSSVVQAWTDARVRHVLESDTLLTAALDDAQLKRLKDRVARFREAVPDVVARTVGDPGWWPHRVSETLEDDDRLDVAGTLGLWPPITAEVPYPLQTKLADALRAWYDPFAALGYAVERSTPSWSMALHDLVARYKALAQELVLLDRRARALRDRSARAQQAARWDAL